MNGDRFRKQLEFIVEIDKLKRVLRRSLVTDGSRRENSAEHSWHLAVMAVVLGEHANDPDLDILHTIKMLLIHDVVEVDAGDTFAYDTQGYLDKEERETKAADRIFGLLPEDQRDEVFALWREFELGETRESRFANALDRLQPLLQNSLTEGATWREGNVKEAQVLTRNQVIERGSARLWQFAQELISEAVAKGHLER